MRTQVLESMTAPVAPQQAAVAEDFAQPPGKFAGPHTRRVLVVDDDSLMRWAVGESLREIGCDVVEAADFCSATRALDAQDRLQLVFLDVCSGDAPELRELAAIRGRWPDVPVVLMTACDANEVRRVSARLDVAAVLRKPFDIGAIGSVADQVLDPPQAIGAGSSS